MPHLSTPRRAGLAVLAASSFVLLAACGGDTKPAAATPGSDGSGNSAGDTHTVVFSPLGLKIPAMQGLAQGVQQYAPTKGLEVSVQDPNLDPQKQATDLQAVIESGKTDAAWVIAVAPQSLSAVVQAAQAKGV